MIQYKMFPIYNLCFCRRIYYLLVGSIVFLDHTVVFQYAPTLIYFFLDFMYYLMKQ
ncbi:hypothetical protein BDA96_01G126600 [Sorghum bicolor]|uniref:Uncharacterized protein n=1 Tax=Sorghum bicolor TaxID=4558 RepID=A0A921RYC9_SORBI|nr:hypothetical protein BDA96_01G126600 [Sorghum bicolor]